MIAPLTITIDHKQNIILASGPHHGDIIGTLECEQGANRTWWIANGHKRASLDAALHDAMARAYAYVAKKIDDAALENLESD